MTSCFDYKDNRTIAKFLHISFKNVLFQKGVIFSFIYFFAYVTFSLVAQMDKKIVLTLNAAVRYDVIISTS